MIKSAKFEIAMLTFVGILAYGIQIPFLGFFQDDWNFVYYYSLNGWQGLLELMTIDGRPGGVWIYALGFSLFGFTPALWQLFSISFRILTAIAAYFILLRLLPERRNANLISSVFFLIYPFFTLQPLSVSFAQHYVGYFLLGLSFLLTIQAVEQPNKYLLFTIPAVLFNLAQLFNVEYFVGLELLRPLLIWHLVSRTIEISWRKRFSKTVLIWLPYFLILVFFILWRSLFLASLGIRNNPLNVLTDSGGIALSVFQYALADLVLMLGSSWSALINPDLFVIGPIRNLYVAVSVVVAAAGFYYLTKSRYLSTEKESTTLRVFLLGGLIIAAGMIPAYSIGYILNNKLPPWNSRFSLPALLGLALVFSELINIIVTSLKVRHALLSILLGLTIGHHNLNTLNFKSAWEKQERLYQQLIWRVPSIIPGTALVSSEEVLGYMGDYPTSMAVNTLYESKPEGSIPYWFFTLSDPKAAQAIATGGALSGSKSSMEFVGDGAHAIYFIFEPENNQCLWVLRPEDGELKQMPASMSVAVLNANLDAILNSNPPHSVFNQILDEDRATWCFYYQKADLARQNGNWLSVVKHWEVAERGGYRPHHGFEFIPFIEGYAYTGDWGGAFELTKSSNKTTKAMYFILCPTWRRLAENTPPGDEKTFFVEKAYDYLACTP